MKMWHTVTVDWVGHLHGAPPSVQQRRVLLNGKSSMRIADIIEEGVFLMLTNQWALFASRFLDLHLHSEQVRFLIHSNNLNDEQLPRENVLHPGNGWGKTEVLAVKHIAKHLFHLGVNTKEPYRSLNLAITTEQATLVFDRVVSLLRSSPILGWMMIGDPVYHPTPRLRFVGGQVMEAKTTKKKAESVEGKQYGYISADEIALESYLEFIREKILLPRLRYAEWSGKQLDFSATPKGKNAYFRIAEQIKRDGGHVQGGTSYNNPFTDHSLWDYFKKTWSEAKVDQVLMGKFIDTSDMMFAGRIDRLFDSSMKFEQVDPSFEYVEAWDLARGRKGYQSDSTVGLRAKMVDDNCGQIVRRWSVQLPWTEAERSILNEKAGSEVERQSIEGVIREAQFMSGARVKIDSTGVGDTLYSMLSDIAERCDFAGGQGSSKDKLLDHAQAVIDAGIIRAPFIPELADEMTTYQRDDKNLPTDNLMAFVILCQFFTLNRVQFGTL